MDSNSADRPAASRKGLLGEILAWGLLTVFVIGLLTSIAPRLFFSAGQTVRIGLVGPMSGPDAELGQAMRAGVESFVERVNASAGEDRRRIEIVVRDDQSKQETARQQALDLAENTDVVAVLGHLDDDTSEEAAPVYAEKGLAAVTGSGGIPDVTANNKWHFRTGLTTSLQGTFLAHYMARVLEVENLIIIHDTDAFGLSLVDALENELSFLKRSGIADLSVKQKWGFNARSPESEEVIAEVIGQLSSKYTGEMIFLAVHEDTAETLIPTIRDNPRLRFGNPIPYKILGPESLGQPSLVQAFAKLRREIQTPGIYSEGVYAVAPFLEDVANQRAQDFRRTYEASYGQAPDAVAAGFRDAAAVVVEALGRLASAPADLAAARKEIRDILAGFDREEKGVPGITGNIYFDLDGNAVKSVPVAVYRGRRLVSPAIQLSTVSSFETVDSNDVLQIKGGYFTRTRIVHTGLRVNEIRDIDLENQRFFMDFDIWFRYRGELDTNAIEFANAAETVHLGAPVEEVSEDGLFYRLHRVQGIFKTDFIGDDSGLGKRVLGMQMRHRELNRERLIIVPDVLGMESGAAGSLTERIAAKTLLGEGDDWTVEQAAMFLDTEPVVKLGNPKFGDREVEGHSRFNLGVWMKPADLALRGFIEVERAKNLFLLCGALISLMLIATHRSEFQPFLKWLWFPQALAAMAMLVTGEVFIADWLTRTFQSSFYLDNAILGFRALWWLVPAWMFNIGVERFLWTPLEQRTERAIPRVVRFFFSLLVYVLAALGVTAFVFDQKVTSLLATSGVLAMIVGLAIQMNISNIFSGIAINVERPFRMGDWIRIGEFEPGRVVGITWRTTRIETLDHNIICIPNSTASDSFVENLSYPREAYRSELMVHVDPGAKPEWVEKILLDAAISANGALQDPAPVVIFHGVKEWSAEYAVRFFCKDYPASIDVNASVWRDIVRNLRYAGFVSVIHEEFTLFHLEEKEGRVRDVTPLLVDDVEVFEPFGPTEKRRICRNLGRRHLEPERVVMRQGDVGDSLFIVAEGALLVEMEMEDGKVIEVGRLGAGDFFGEGALLTGEPRGATVTTMTPSLVLEIAKADIEPIILEYPEIIDDLSKILTRRTLENLRKRNAYFASVSEEKSLARSILTKIGKFFDVRVTGAVDDAPEPLPERRSA